MMGDRSLRHRLPGSRIMVHDYGDEVVVANLESGWFYSLTGAHRSLWCALADGWTADEVLGAFDGDTALLAPALDELIVLAAQGGLLTAGPGDAPDGALSPIQWQLGGIEAFDDLQDALLLDPVHDVGEAGWPYVASGD